VEFESVIARHMNRYPLMEPQDLGKLAYQSALGPGHMIPDEGWALERLREEWGQIPPNTPRRKPEEVGGGLCRFYLYDESEKELAIQVLCKLFCLTAKNYVPKPGALEDRLSVVENAGVSGMGAWLTDYRKRGCPAVGHSDGYRAAYVPHYRLLKREYAAAFPALLETAKLLARKERVTVAVDGRCGSGKSTLGALMEAVFSCRVFHMDDFYLPRQMRAENWLEIPGGNMDLERFRREVLEPVFAGQQVDYRPYDCTAEKYVTQTPVPFTRLTVIEGSYSHHPALEADYDLKIFVSCGKEEQLRRLREREGDYFSTFMRVWMPLEEQYIRLCGIEQTDALTVDTGAMTW